jgi:peptidoglycan/LPS O-acetylase OafA/YrhL
VNRLKPLDTIRGIAALIVAFFSHYHHFDHQMNPVDQPLYSVLGIFYENGWNMVDLFFVLSGVVFSYVYGKKIRDSKISAREYSVFRFSRLYPLHLATLLFVAALFIFGVFRGFGIFVYPESDLKYFVANVFFVQSGITPWTWTFNGPAWSISCEIIAYISFFLIFKYFYKWRIPIAGSLIVVGFVFRHWHTHLIIINSDIGRLLMGFFVGILIYEALFSEKLTQTHFVFISVGLLSGFAVAFYLRPSAWSYPAVVFLYPGLIIAAIKFNVFNSILSQRGLTYLGDISYSVYLLHFPVQLAIFTLTKQFHIDLPYTSVWVFLGYGGLVVLVSILSYEYFEKPVQSILRKRLLKA